MVQKYTILKVLIRTSSKGFTLLELIVGMAIMLIIGGLAMNAFIEASNSFRNDKRNIDNDQNMSAILEMIGNDIKQSGEQINDPNFPTVEITGNTISGTIVTASSTIIVRRALIPPLTLCQTIPANLNNASPLPPTLLVADSTLTGTTSCAPGTLTTTANPTPVNRPSALMEARRYRCKLDDINADYTAINTTDYCRTTKPSPASSDLEQVWAAISDGNGRIRIFSYADDSEVVSGTDRSYRISVGLFDNGTSTMLATADSRNTGVAYDIGRPIYLIEERRYTLDNDGNLKVSVDGGANFSTLIKGISRFKVSAKLYSDTTTKAIQTAPANGCAGDTQYTCRFNFNTAITDPAYNWKTLAGIKVELQARYDPTGRNLTASAKDLEKLTAVAEFFPRNVLSK